MDSALRLVKSHWLCEEMIIPIGAEKEGSLSKVYKYFRREESKRLPDCHRMLLMIYRRWLFMTALRDLNIKVPDDISIIGNDDIHFTETYSVPLQQSSPRKEQ